MRLSAAIDRSLRTKFVVLRAVWLGIVQTSRNVLVRYWNSVFIQRPSVLGPCAIASSAWLSVEHPLAMRLSAAIDRSLRTKFVVLRAVWLGIVQTFRNVLVRYCNSVFSQRPSGNRHSFRNAKMT